MPFNIYELEGLISSVPGGTFLGKAVYEGATSFVQSMTSVDQSVSRSHGDVAFFYGLLFITAIGGILHANSHSTHIIEDQTGQDYPNVNA